MDIGLLSFIHRKPDLVDIYFPLLAYQNQVVSPERFQVVRIALVDYLSFNGLYGIAYYTVRCVVVFVLILFYSE